MKKTLIIFGIFILLIQQIVVFSQSKTIPLEQNSKNTTYHQAETLFKTHKNHIQIKGEGTVIKILTDDLKGSKHQRFIIRYSPSLTLLIVHNIDIAPRLNNIKIGDNIEFFGEYIWNKKGGIIHWTHRDPQKKHINGYLKFKDKK